MSRILIIGATGRAGREVAAQLGDAGVRARALVRKPEGAGLPAHIEVVRGDLTAPETLDAALDGIDKVFLVWTAPAGAVSAALERIARPGRRIVFLSAPIKTRHPLFQQPNPVREVTAGIERMIEASGCEWTFVRPGMFAANAVWWWGPQLRAGDTVRWPHLETATAPIDERDIAAVAVRALCDQGHAGAEYVVTGPESLTQRQQIVTIGRATGRALRLEEIPPAEAKAELLTLFPAYPEFVVKMLLDAWAAAAGQPAYVTTAVAKVTGRPARTFGEWAADHAGAFSQ
jgi:uncharacterized protein YbjT (DUF2867 family)